MGGQMSDGGAAGPDGRPNRTATDRHLRRAAYTLPVAELSERAVVARVPALASQPSGSSREQPVAVPLDTSIGDCIRTIQREAPAICVVVTTRYNIGVLMSECTCRRLVGLDAAVDAYATVEAHDTSRTLVDRARRPRCSCRRAGGSCPGRGRRRTPGRRRAPIDILSSSRSPSRRPPEPPSPSPPAHGARARAHPAPVPVPAEPGRHPPELPDRPRPRAQPRPAVVRARGTYLVDAVSYGRVRGKPFLDHRDRRRGATAPRRAELTDDRDRQRDCPHKAHPQGLRRGPGSPLVPGLRRLLDPRPRCRRSCRELGVPRENIVFISGIGCSEPASRTT